MGTWVLWYLGTPGLGTPEYPSLFWVPLVQVLPSWNHRAVYPRVRYPRPGYLLVWHRLSTPGFGTPVLSTPSTPRLDTFGLGTPLLLHTNLVKTSSGLGLRQAMSCFLSPYLSPVNQWLLGARLNKLSSRSKSYRTNRLMAKAQSSSQYIKKGQNSLQMILHCKYLQPYYYVNLSKLEGKCVN